MQPQEYLTANKCEGPATAAERHKFGNERHAKSIAATQRNGKITPLSPTGDIASIDTTHSPAGKAAINSFA